jgi:hypothetical protein
MLYRMSDHLASLNEYIMADFSPTLQHGEVHEQERKAAKAVALKVFGGNPSNALR